MTHPTRVAIILGSYSQRSSTARVSSRQTIPMTHLDRLALVFNPFEPTATGVPLAGNLRPLGPTHGRVKEVLDHYTNGDGAKAFVIRGEYGAGKTCILRWLHESVFPQRRIRSFYFSDPGVHFYKLANSLLRRIGRRNFAKLIWEVANPQLHASYQRDLFSRGFEAFALATNSRRDRHAVTETLEDAIKAADITDDEEIAFHLARIVTTTVTKPYFEYRDFVPRLSGSIVPEREEPGFFHAILKTLTYGEGVDAIAFLIDEFEEIGLQNSLTRKAAHDYLTTLKRLVALTQDRQIATPRSPGFSFWLVLSMTPPAYTRTVDLEPSLAREQRLGEIVDIEPLDSQTAEQLVRTRLSHARTPDVQNDALGLFPFPDQLVDPSGQVLSPGAYSTPRRLIKICYSAVASYDGTTPLPFSTEYLQSIEKRLYGPPDTFHLKGRQ